MSSEAITQVKTRGAIAPRGRRGSRGRPFNSRSRQHSTSTNSPQAQPARPPPSDIDNAAVGLGNAGSQVKDVGDAEESPVCWICAEPVKYYSLSECNHRTCHVCALRLRALYKRTDCTFCKDPQPTVIFTVSPDALFSSYAPDAIPYKDSKLSIFFETSEMMEETLILLRYNCPLSDCDFIASGWSDLTLHVRASHGKVMCDLCIRFKKVFSHEHAVYAPTQLYHHLPSLLNRPHRPMTSEQIEGGVHPFCQFCRECFFGDDELFSHMRERHEECFVCKRNDIRDQYFKDYDSLDKHFNSAHHPCTQPQCLAHKFVVFDSALDLKAHMVEEHGADMTSRDKKETRRIQADFEFEEDGRGGGRGRRDRGGAREREREPPPRDTQNQGQPPDGSGPTRPNGNARRREAFGTHLTTDGPSDQNLHTSTVALNRRLSPSPSREGADPITIERHAAFMARLQSLVTHHLALPAIKAAIRGYRTSESSARDLISTIWNILDQNLDDTASVVVGLVDLIEDDHKKSDLLSSWNGFKIEQRRKFPDLVPSEVGSGYAGITSGRVLNAKHSTAIRSSQQSSRQVWDRVAQAASTSSPSPSSSSAHPAPTPRPPNRFPPLPPPLTPIPGPAPVPAYRQVQRNTPWASSSASGVRTPLSMPVSSSSPAASRRELTNAGSAASSASGKQPPKLSSALFPELPASSTARAKASVKGNMSLKNIVGDATPVVPAWKAAAGNVSGGDENGNAVGQGTTDATGDSAGSGKSKKGKGKQKQTLFTLGSFPT